MLETRDGRHAGRMRFVQWATLACLCLGAMAVSALRAPAEDTNAESEAPARVAGEGESRSIDGQAGSAAEGTPPKIDALPPLPTSATYKTFWEFEDRAPSTSETMVLWPHRTRTQHPGGSVTISNRGTGLTLVPREKKAFITERPKDTEPPKDDEEPGLFGTLRKLLADPKYLAETKRELLGESEIDGRRAIGYRLTSPGGITTIWADPDSLLPIQTEMAYRMHPGMKSIHTDYVYNVDLDESLFSVEPPPDYTVLRRTEPKEPTAYEESDLVELFREHRESNQDTFPETVDARAAQELERMKFDLRKERTEQEWREIDEFGREVYRGLRFVAGLPTEADAHYAGKGVKFDATDTPIFWYRPEGNGKYRVIRADLSVVEVDSPPEIPGAQALGDWERDVRASRRPSPKPTDPATAYTVENLAPLVRQLGILPFSLRNELRVRVLPESVAEKAGMRTGDRVTALYGVPVQRIEHVAAVWALVPFYAKARKTLAENGVPLTIMRDGEQVEVTLPGDALQPFFNPTAQNGYDLQSLAALVRQIGIESDSDEPTREDVLKVRILPNSAAEKAGIRSGDRIIALAGGQVVRLKDVLGLLAWVPLDDEWWQRVGNEGVHLMILREGEKIEVTLPGDVVKKLARLAGRDG